MWDNEEMMMFGYVKKERFDELEKRVKELECATADYAIYAESAWKSASIYGGYPEPIVRVSLWSAIKAIIKHAGLEMNGVAATPPTFTLDKAKK